MDGRLLNHLLVLVLLVLLLSCLLVDSRLLNRLLLLVVDGRLLNRLLVLSCIASKARSSPLHLRG